MQLEGLGWPTLALPYKEQSCAGLEGQEFKAWRGRGQGVARTRSRSAAVAGRQAGALIEQIALLLGLGQAVLAV